MLPQELLSVPPYLLLTPESSHYLLLTTPSSPPGHGLTFGRVVEAAHLHRFGSWVRTGLRVGCGNDGDLCHRGVEAGQQPAHTTHAQGATQELAAVDVKHAIAKGQHALAKAEGRLGGSRGQEGQGGMGGGEVWLGRGGCRVGRESQRVGEHQSLTDVGSDLPHCSLHKAHARGQDVQPDEVWA